VAAVAPALAVLSLTSDCRHDELSGNESRTARVEPGWSETFLNHEQAGACSLAESVANGHSIIQIDLLASSVEAHTLKFDALAAADKRLDDNPEHSRQIEQQIVALRAAYLKAEQPWRTRSAFSNRGPRTDRLPLYALPASGAALCDELLLRALSVMDGHIDGQLTRDLFGDCLADDISCRYNPRLRFAKGEPAINVYASGGAFKPHEDKEALTILVPLSEASKDFDGGGTAFWSISDAGPGGSISVNEGTMQAPTLVLRPPAGTAIIFGGDVTHAGKACTGGRRCIFVASFSPKTNEHLVAALDRKVAQRAAHLIEADPTNCPPPVGAQAAVTKRTTTTSSQKRMAEILGGRG